MTRKKFEEKLDIPNNRIEYILSISTGEKLEFPHRLTDKRLLDVYVDEWWQGAGGIVPRVGKMSVRIIDNDGDVIENRKYNQMSWVAVSEILTRIYNMTYAQNFVHGKEVEEAIRDKITSMRKTDAVPVYKSKKDAVDQMKKQMERIVTDARRLRNISDHHPLDYEIARTSYDNDPFLVKLFDLIKEEKCPFKKI